MALDAIPAATRAGLPGPHPGGGGAWQAPSWTPSLPSAGVSSPPPSSGRRRVDEQVGRFDEAATRGADAIPAVRFSDLSIDLRHCILMLLPLASDLKPGHPSPPPRLPQPGEVMSSPNAPPQMGEDSEMSRRVHSTSTELGPAPALDDDNLLAEFLLRLPPLPSSLPRASLVCKRWRRLVSEPHFPPALPDNSSGDITRFISTLDSPDCIPAANFSLQLAEHDTILDCRHGLVLILNRSKEHVHIWDPVTRNHRYVALSPAFNDVRMFVMGGIVLCAAKDQGHVHGACHSNPFKVVLVGENGVRFCFSVYSSDTGAWGNISSLPWPLLNMRAFLQNSGILIGNSVCWLVIMERVKILQFDLDEQILVFMDIPSNVYDLNACHRYIPQKLIMPVDGGGINFIVLEGFTVCVWKRMSSDTGDASWMLGNTFELSNLLSLRPSGHDMPVLMLASSEDEDLNGTLALLDYCVTLVMLTVQFSSDHPGFCFSDVAMIASWFVEGNDVRSEGARGAALRFRTRLHSPRLMETPAIPLVRFSSSQVSHRPTGFSDQG
ncbi:hypothetical protein PR202_gb11017 [Eleusine coracana subsp. coracana]|uniref:F-box domain-containing protein n=1 Tax=Eleusine coracana subsp. coracana TaxID=191504 RepID=A0AAV5EKV8_ELECO|nr:hypothetical protein PR202_gb11017 [Eleusine coracana subsp. coracana]